MRFLLLTLLGLFLAADSEFVGESVRAGAERGPLVLLVHGRGQLGFDSAATRREWQRDLDTALARAAMPPLRSQDVHLAWYADALDPESRESCRPAATSDTAAIGWGALARALFASLTSALPRDDDARGARSLFGDLLFFIDEDTRCVAARPLARALDAAARERRPVVIVAYSLGSLVAYEHLRDRQDAREAGELRLITIGSPLGLAEVRQILLLAEGDSLRVPERVRSWENVYDPDDPFAAPLAGLVGGAVVQDREIRGDRPETAHHIDRYLRDRAVGEALASALCATPARDVAAACARRQTAALSTPHR